MLRLLFLLAGPILTLKLLEVDGKHAVSCMIAVYFAVRNSPDASMDEFEIPRCR